MLRQLEEQKHEIEREQEERRKMQHKIQEMQSKLITGGKDIITHTSEQEQILRQKRLVGFLIVFDLLFELFFKDV
jgi:kinesin family protein 3/17